MSEYTSLLIVCVCVCGNHLCVLVVWIVCILSLACGGLLLCLQSVCTVADVGTDTNSDKYVLRLLCSLSSVCVCVCVRVLNCASACAYVPGTCCKGCMFSLKQSSADSVGCPSIPTFFFPSVSCSSFWAFRQPSSLFLLVHVRKHTRTCTFVPPPPPPLFLLAYSAASSLAETRHSL